MDINVIAPWKVHGLRDLLFLANKTSIAAHLSFAGRRRSRRIANENEISEILRHRNFEIVEARKSFWREQQTCSPARVVIVGATWRGAGQHRVLQAWNARGGDQYRAGYRDWYWQLAAVAGLSYEVMKAQRSGSFSDRMRMPI